MYVYDMVAIMLIGFSHVFLYLQLIRYNRFSYTMVIILSIVFTILLGIVVTVTGYPEFNIIMLLLFLFSLGLMKDKLPFMKNLYFALVSMVTITLVKMVFMFLSMKWYMWTAFNLYSWTASLIHMIVSIIIVISIWLLRMKIQRPAMFITESRLYYISYVLLAIGLMIELILSFPSTGLLAALYQQYGQISFIMAFVLFFVLLLIILISTHISKERMLEEQQEHLDKELLDYVEKLELMHDELANFRHDYMNILVTLNEGVRTKDIAQIEQVYHDVIAPTAKLMNNQELDIVKLSRIAIPEVKSLLSVKVTTAQQHVNVMIDIPQRIKDIAMPMVAFIRSISILIDNGIEEATRSSEKVLQLAFFEMEGCQYFIVRNSCRQGSIDLQQLYVKHFSSKKGSQGYGLYSLKSLIDKTDNATLETNVSHPYFTQTLLLKK